jgi:hypothetical protein
MGITEKAKRGTKKRIDRELHAEERSCGGELARSIEKWMRQDRIGVFRSSIKGFTKKGSLSLL